MTHEQIRLSESSSRKKHWKRWGPYLSERAWGTVREDYSPHGNAWEYFPHDHARSRAYRWNEDGLAGICDRHQFICFALALWNERDPILKERLFGLAGSEGNHGEDVKEQYFYLDSAPTHSYMKYLYKYPQCEFPYVRLIEENRGRGKDRPEFELLDTGVFDDDRYFDVFVEYAKVDVDDILIKITVANRGPEPANIRVLPTIWFRNTWSWGNTDARPELHQSASGANPVIELNHSQLGTRCLQCEGAPEIFFTENETNYQRLFGVQGRTAYAKDGINNYIINGTTDAVNPLRKGTKAAAHYALTIAPGDQKIIRLRLLHSPTSKAAFPDFEEIMAQRQREADEFYATIIPRDLSTDAQIVMRQGFAGTLWSKQFYHYVVRDWLEGDTGNPLPPSERKSGRNREWAHLYNSDVISMPDKWEYPWEAPILHDPVQPRNLHTLGSCSVARMARDQWPRRVRVFNHHWPQHTPLSRTFSDRDETSRWPLCSAFENGGNVLYRRTSFRTLRQSLSGRRASTGLPVSQAVPPRSFSGFYLRNRRYRDREIGFHDPQ